MPPKYRNVAAVRGTSSPRESRRGCPVSRLSSWASSSAWPSMASASRSRSLPRSAAGRADQAGNAAVAALTARSMSSARASATRASTEQSCGSTTSRVAPASPSTNSPSMKRPVCTSHGSWITAAGRLEVDGIRGGAALGDHLGEGGRPVLPDEQHRPLGRVALVAGVGGGGGHVAGLHDDARSPGARLLVGDVPLDLVGQLHEPLDPVVAVDDRQDVLLGGRAV